MFVSVCVSYVFVCVFFGLDGGGSIRFSHVSQVSLLNVFGGLFCHPIYSGRRSTCCGSAILGHQSAVMEVLSHRSKVLAVIFFFPVGPPDISR